MTRGALESNVDRSLSDMANELSDSLLTSFAPDGDSYSAVASSLYNRPEATQASEETLVARCFFEEGGPFSDDGSEGCFRASFFSI